MLVEAFFSTLVSFCLVQLLHNTEKFSYFLTALFLNQKRKAGNDLPLSIFIIIKSLLLLPPRYLR